jgi:hypothetical protein
LHFRAGDKFAGQVIFYGDGPGRRARLELRLARRDRSAARRKAPQLAGGRRR